MVFAFLISVTYALAGIAYYPGAASVVGMIFIAFSCLPFLFTQKSPGGSNYCSIPAASSFVYWLCIAGGFANIWVLIQSTGYSVVDLLNLEGALGIASQATLARYLDGGPNGHPLLMSMSLYLLCRQGMSSGQSHWSKSALAFAPLFVLSILSTAKYPAFVGICFFMAGFLSSRPVAKAIPVIPHYAFAVVVVGFLLGSTSMFFRGADLQILFAPLLHYVLAPYPAFGNWLMDSALISCCQFGAYSFIGPMDAAGLVERQSGVFVDEFVAYGRVTNIMTAWKYLVIDFSVLGPLITNSLLVLAWNLSMKIRIRPLTRAIELFAIFAALLSVVATPFVHNSVAFALLGSMLTYLALDHRIQLVAPENPVDELLPIRS